MKDAVIVSHGIGKSQMLGVQKAWRIKVDEIVYPLENLIEKTPKPRNHETEKPGNQEIR